MISHYSQCQRERRDALQAHGCDRSKDETEAYRARLAQRRACPYQVVITSTADMPYFPSHPLFQQGKSHNAPRNTQDERAWWVLLCMTQAVYEASPLQHYTAQALRDMRVSVVLGRAQAVSTTRLALTDLMQTLYTHYHIHVRAPRPHDVVLWLSPV